MPFTVSHAVLAPILSRVSQNYLPIAALAIGCMAPDLYRLFTDKNYIQPHQWQSIFSVTLWIGLGFCLLWYGLYRPVIYRFLNLKDRLYLYNSKRILRFTVMNMIAVTLGICTHLIWDGLTHVDFRTLILHDFLSLNVNLLDKTYPMHRILQISTSFLALPFVLWMCWSYFKKHRQTHQVSQKVKLYAIGLLLLSLSIGAFSFLDYLRHIPAHYLEIGLYYITGTSINEFTQGFLITFSLGCLLFLFLDRHHRLD